MNSIQRYRLAATMNRPQLARKLGISVPTLWRFERGISKPRAETLQKLSKIFGVTMEEVLKESK